MTASSIRRLPVLAALTLGLAAVGLQAQTLTRDDVAAELARARAAGELHPAQDEVQAAGVLTLPAKAAPVTAAQAARNVAALAATPMALTREQVIAELARARADGELDAADDELGTVTVASTQRQARVLARRQGSADTAVAGRPAANSAQ